MDADYPPEIERYMLPTVIKLESGCWFWTGGIKAGYGESRKQFGGKPKSFRAHRVFYEALNGKIPSGMCIDHTCSEKLCVNPDHLEVVTREENNRRSADRLRGKVQPRRTQVCEPRPGDENKFCVRGHPFIGNRRTLLQGGTYCVACNNEASRRYAERRRKLKG